MGRPLCGGAIFVILYIWDKNISPFFEGVSCIEMTLNGGSKSLFVIKI